AFFNQWMMPLFFIVSGAAVVYSLRSRNARGFLKERVLRILVTWVLIGIFVIAPPQVYLERLTHGDFSRTFFQFYPHYFEGVYGFGGNFAIVPLHLWYLVFLFIFSLIALPLCHICCSSFTGILSSPIRASRKQLKDMAQSSLLPLWFWQ
ncbi:acyltransferase family protein, partial [Chloroflexota bacterium]